MKVVYIAHPVGGDVKGNLLKITRIIREINLKEEEIIPFAPYVADVLAMIDEIPEERERACKNGLNILRTGMVDEIWVYGPSITRGMKDEIDLAWELKIPIIVKDKDTEVLCNEII